MKIYKKSLAEKKWKAWNKKVERGGLLNLTKVRITVEGNGSVKMNMGKGGVIMNITMMTLI